ncbi:MAG: hypothetical protein ACFCD0_21920, partial [Gemmataceae bacterium]
LPFLGAKNFESDVASCEFFGLSEDKRLSQSREPAHFYRVWHPETEEPFSCKHKPRVIFTLIGQRHIPYP